MKTISLSLIFVLLVSAQQATQPPAQAPKPAQQPAAETPTGGVVKFAASTQLVIETVSVKDKNGNPVEGLTAKDFTVTEDGVPQTISFCEFQKLEEVVPAELERRPEDKPAVTTPVPATPAVAGVTAHQITPEKPGDIRYRDRRLMAQ